MALYETVFIARQDISAKAAEDLATSFAKIVNDNGGEVKRTESWGLRSLAYKIKKNRKGHYTLMHIEAPASAIVEMERIIKLNEDVLRHMTVRIEKLPEGPSAILKSSDEGEDGGFRGGDREERGGFRGGDRGGFRGGDRGGFKREYNNDRAAPAAATEEGAE